MSEISVLYNGVVHSLDADNSVCEAIAIHGERVVAVGKSSDLRRDYPDADLIDLEGAHLYPAFVDAHCHPLGLGERLLKPRLEGTKSKEDVYGILRPLVGKNDWLVSRGWDQNLWPNKALPSRIDLDSNVSADLPIALTRIDGHALWCNSAALRIAGITALTGDPVGGSILHDATGEPTGILIDEAMKLVESHIPLPSLADLQRTLSAGLTEFLKHGIATVHDMGVSAEVWEAYRALYATESDRLPHAYVFLDMTKQTGRELFLSRIATLAHDLPPRMHFAGIKLYLDGALGSRGAELFEDYSDDPGNRGLALMEDDDAIQLMQLASRHHLQIAVHAIGDRACSRALDLFEKAELNGRNATLRIEHAQILRDEDVKRMAALGVFGLVQPAFYKSDRHWALERLGPERMKRAYRWRSLIDAGAFCIGSSDAPIESPNVLETVRLLLSRDGAQDGEAVDSITAIRMYCDYPYSVDSRPMKRGELETGQIADFTIVDRDATDPKANIVATYIDGKPLKQDLRRVAAKKAVTLRS